MKSCIGTALLLAGLAGLTAAPVAAATVTSELHLRQGPGTGYGVIASMPAGARVDVRSCTASWCRVAWRGYSGYASARYISGESRTVRRRVLRRRVARPDLSAPGALQRYRAPKYWGYNHEARPGGTDYRPAGNYGPPF